MERKIGHEMENESTSGFIGIVLDMQLMSLHRA